jgi:hypothetical protein
MMDLISIGKKENQWVSFCMQRRSLERSVGPLLETLRAFISVNGQQARMQPRADGGSFSQRGVLLSIKWV